MRKPIVGEKLYSLNVGNAARDVEQILEPVVVSKVGRKYFYCGNPKYPHMHNRYFIDAWDQENGGYSRTSVLYESEEEYQEEKETSNICTVLGESFKYGGNNARLSIEKLRKILEIVNS